MSNREQKLIDIVFQVGMLTLLDYDKYFKSMSREEYADWISRQLRECGFDTEPRGMSWGILKK